MKNSVLAITSLLKVKCVSHYPGDLSDSREHSLQNFYTETSCGGEFRIQNWPPVIACMTARRIRCSWWRNRENGYIGTVIIFFLMWFIQRWSTECTFIGRTGSTKIIGDFPVLLGPFQCTVQQVTQFNKMLAISSFLYQHGFVVRFV